MLTRNIDILTHNLNGRGSVVKSAAFDTMLFNRKLLPTYTCIVLPGKLPAYSKTLSSQSVYHI